MSRPKTATGSEVSEINIPSDKKELVLAVCHKFGIPATYHSRKFQTDFEITVENMNEFHNLDFLLTTKFALVKLLTTPLEKD